MSDNNQSDERKHICDSIPFLSPTVFKAIRRKRNNKYRPRWFILCLATAFALLTGCGQNTSQTERTYGNDGYMGLSNSNPGLPNRFLNLNYGNDANFIKQVLRPFDEIRDTQVFFNGTDAHVNIKVKGNLNASEIQQIEDKAARIVSFNMPRYHVHVKALQ